MNRLLVPLLAPVAAALLVLTACSSGTTTSTPESTAAAPAATSTTAPAGPTITIADMQFGSPLTVAPGATVTVVNSDGPEHSVTADSGNAFDVDIDGKGTATFTAPTKPGTYAYHCTYHPSMHGQLVVA